MPSKESKQTKTTADKAQAWPPPYPGGTMYDQAEVDAAMRVLQAQSPFRHYGIDLQNEADKFEQVIFNDESSLVLNLLHKRLEIFRPCDLDRLIAAAANQMMAMT